MSDQSLTFSDDSCNEILPKVNKSASASTKFRNEGNELYFEKHNKDSHMHVLSLYTKSIAFAPENSEELALGLGNRSALLIHIKKYEECIIDIERALSISRSVKLIDKLSSRRDTCLKLVSVSKFSKPAEVTSKNFKLPTMKYSKKVPCLAESLSLENNEKYGNHIIANQDIKPGEFIAVEEAYISYPLKNKIYLVCSYCLCQTYNGIPCNYCTETVYCSERCKNQAWNEYHDIECSIISNSPLPLIDYDSSLDTSVIYKATLRLFIKIIKNNSLEKIIHEIRSPDLKTFDGTFFCNNFKSIYNLTTKTEKSEIRKKISQNFVSMAINTLSQFKSIFTDKVTTNFESKYEMVAFFEQLLTKLLDIIDINAYSFDDINKESEDILTVENMTINCPARGIIFTPCCSLFNHSCDPNLKLIFTEKRKIVIFSDRFIKKGEQLFINYFGGFITQCTPKQNRQNMLQIKFEFTCNCQVCIEDWILPTVDEYEKRLDSQIMLEIATENEKFCLREEIKSTIKDDLKNENYNEDTLKQIKFIVELIFKKFDTYTAVMISDVLRDYLELAYQNFYGIEWKTMSNCLKSM